MNREEIFSWVRERYETEPDHPWNDDNAVLRHRENKRWYAVVLSVSENKLGLPGAGIVNVLNVKCDPILVGSLRRQKGFFPAYHMNKDRWLSILLDGSVPEEEIKSLIDFSYKLTAKK